MLNSASQVVVSDSDRTQRVTYGPTVISSKLGRVPTGPSSILGHDCVNSRELIQLFSKAKMKINSLTIQLRQDRHWFDTTCNCVEKELDSAKQIFCVADLGLIILDSVSRE